MDKLGEFWNKLGKGARTTIIVVAVILGMSGVGRVLIMTGLAEDPQVVREREAAEKAAEEAKAEAQRQAEEEKRQAEEAERRAQAEAEQKAREEAEAARIADIKAHGPEEADSDVYTLMIQEGERRYPYGFELNIIGGTKVNERTSDFHYIVKITCDVTNMYGATAKDLICEATAVYEDEEWKLTSFEVY